MDGLNNAVGSLRGTLAWLEQQEELIRISKPADPIIEIPALVKKLEAGPALLFEQLKGYPDQTLVANIFSTKERMARIFGVADARKVKLRYVEAQNNPLAPEIVENAPAQELVFTKNINVPATMPIVQNTPQDAGPIIGGGIVFLNFPGGGTSMGYKRLHFRGPDWSSIGINFNTGLENILLQRKWSDRGKVPVTINVCPSPAVMVVAATGFNPLTMPYGADKVGIAGALQGEPVRLCRAKTVDTMSLADSEWVIEGYIDTAESVWECDPAETEEKTRQTILFPEILGYYGFAQKTFKFQATAITHRRNPIFFGILADTPECANMIGSFREASVYDLCSRVRPGLVSDVNILDAFNGLIGVAIQVKKRSIRDEGYIKILTDVAMASSWLYRYVIIVDDDVDIYSEKSVLWAIATRTNPATSIDVRTGYLADATNVIARAEEGRLSLGAGRVVIDATIPYKARWRLHMAEYADVNLSDWLSPEQVRKFAPQAK